MVCTFLDFLDVSFLSQYIECRKRKKNSITHIMYIFDRVHKVLNERKDQSFKPLKVSEILKLKEEDAGSIYHSVVKSFESELLKVCKNAVNYLEKSSRFSIG